MRRWFCRRVRSSLGFTCGVGCFGAEFFPVISVVADEVGDFTEGLIQDGLLGGHVLVWRGVVFDDDMITEVVGW